MGNIYEYSIQDQHDLGLIYTPENVDCPTEIESQPQATDAEDKETDENEERDREETQPS